MRIHASLNALIIVILSAATLLGQTDDSDRSSDADTSAEVTRPLTALSGDESDGLPQLSNTPSDAEGSVQANTEQPLPAGTGGQIDASSLSERMESIRRKAVDTPIARPFLVTDPREMVPQGALPQVKKRSLKEPPVTEQPVAAQPHMADGRSSDPTSAATASPSGSRPVETAPVRQQQSVLLSNQASALSVETVGPKTIVIGRESTYRVSMINTGQLDARNVIVSISLPTWAEVTGFTATTGTPTVLAEGGEEATLKWPIAMLPARQQEELTLKIVARDGRPFELGVGWAFAPEHSTAQIQVQEPKLEMDIRGPGEVIYGSTELFTISLSNPGTGNAENVVLNLMPLGAQQPIAGSRDLGTLRAGERKTIELELTAHQAGRLQVRAMALADGGLRTETAHDVMVRQPVLEMEVLGPSTSFASTTAAYQVHIQNTGDATAEETTLTTALPPGAKFVSSTDGGRYDADQGLIQWSVGAIRPGAVRILEWSCEMHAAGDNRFDVQCNAAPRISAGKSVITQVEALADLKLRVNDPKGAVEIGTDATYEISVINRGTKAAEMVQLTGYFSEGIEPVSLHGLRGHISTGQVVMEPIAVIAPGQEVTCRILARAVQPGNHVFRAELQCQNPETRLAAEEWTKYFRSMSPGGDAAEQNVQNSQQGDSIRLGDQPSPNRYRE